MAEEEDTQAKLREWLAQKLDERGHGAKAELAGYMNISRAAVTRLFKPQKGQGYRTISADELRLIAEFFGEMPPVFEIKREGLIPDEPPVGLIPVIGKVSAGNWKAADEVNSDFGTIPSARGFPIKAQFGLVVDGTSLNKIAETWDRLICIDTNEMGMAPNIGDLVIVQRSRFSGQMIEFTAKRLHKTADGYELWPESTDPEYQEPIKIDKLHTNKTDEVRIMGKVLWILRRP